MVDMRPRQLEIIVTTGGDAADPEGVEIIATSPVKHIEFNRNSLCCTRDGFVEFFKIEIEKLK